MTYNTKAEFMAALKSQAEKYSLSFGEMAEDFERHFSEGEENGETESEICAKLGDPVEIVQEYVGENSENGMSFLIMTWLLARTRLCRILRSRVVLLVKVMLTAQTRRTM